MHRLEQRYNTEVGFVYLDIDDPAVDGWKKQLGYRSIPQFVLLDARGEIIEQWLGLVPEESFTAALEAALAGGTPP